MSWGLASRRRGAVVVLAAAAMVMLLILVAFAVDLGYLYTVRAELQTAADAGALAGSAELAENRGRATQLAKDFVTRNVDVQISDIDVQFGNWDYDDRTFERGVEPRDALEVTVFQPKTPLFFGKLIGRSQQNVAGRAIAAFRPRDIVLVLDYSGSMNEYDRIKELKNAVRLFVNTLQNIEAEDRVGFVRYSTDAQLKIPMTDDLNDVDAQTRASTADGWTNIGGGMYLGRRELEQRARFEAAKTMILMTDGKVNRPLDRNPRTYVTDEARRAKASGISIITISFGDDADRALMQEVADLADGVHFNVPDSVSGNQDDLREVFRKIAVNRPVILVQ